MYEIEDKMTEAGFDNQRVKEAQVLYVLALSDFSEEAGFVDVAEYLVSAACQTREISLSCVRF